MEPPEWREITVERLKLRLNFRTAPYFIMHAGHCLRKTM